MSVIPFRSRVSRRVIAACCLLFLPVAARAQTGARLTGRIVDSTGAPILGARVRIPSLERGGLVDSAGRFDVDGLPTGRLTVVGEAPGYFGRRVEVTLPVSGVVEQSFELRVNAHVLASVDVRARMRERLPDKLAEFASRRTRGTGRFLGPADVAKFNGQPLTEALRTVLTGARIERTNGSLTIISSRSLNVPSSIRTSMNAKSCGVQIWQDGVLMSDPQSSADLVQGTGPTSRQVTTMHVGADREYDLTGLLSDSYMAIEYYSDLATTPPGFRTGTSSCGVLVLWTRVPMPGEKGPA